MTGGLSPRALAHPHASPAPGCDRPPLLFLTVHVQGTGGAQAISGSEKPGCPAQNGPVLGVVQSWAHMAILATLGKQEPFGTHLGRFRNGHILGPLFFPLTL